MNTSTSADQSLFRRAVIESAELSEDDLRLVLELIEHLKRRRDATSSQDVSSHVVAIRQAARQRAELLKSVSRDQLVARFLALTETIRQQAIANGTAIDGDWRGD